jgi:peptidoglycan/xylan/chitin deacetylase (PgdA/CDA1 family)
MTFIAPHYNKARKKTAFHFLEKDRYLVKTPWWLKKLYPGCVWDMPIKEKTLYLTFDDGPHPTITPFILEQLKKYDAKATFFCIGDNAAKYPDAFQQVIDEGHAVGNHSFHHINGWKNSGKDYLNDIKKAGEYIHSNLFRPPYGRIKRSQLNLLRHGENKMTVVMWNILAGDWDQSLDPALCFERVKRKVSDGDIIVFHDSEKAWVRMSYSLPKLLEYYTSKGYCFSKIDQSFLSV